MDCCCFYLQDGLLLLLLTGWIVVVFTYRMDCCCCYLQDGLLLFLLGFWEENESSYARTKQLQFIYILKLNSKDNSSLMTMRQVCTFFVYQMCKLQI